MGKLFSKIYRALRPEILSSQRLSGENLIEQGLANPFAGSRTPIREAMRQLQPEGLSESASRGGDRPARAPHRQSGSELRRIMGLEANVILSPLDILEPVM